jgi:hypothetical protein
VISQDGKTTTITVPRTREQIAALINQREALSNQLENVSDRRHDLAQELAGTSDEVARTGLQERLRMLDQRILRLESDLDATGRQLSLAPPNMVSTVEVGMTPPDHGDEFPEGFAVGGASALVFCAVVYSFVRARYRRRGRGMQKGTLGDDSAQRLQRLEQGMEAIAIEIERVSEGQRFVTKLLSQTQAPESAPSNDAARVPAEQQSINR